MTRMACMTTDTTSFEQSPSTKAATPAADALDPRDDLATAIALAGRTLAAVRPDQYDAPTPCEDFDVRRLSSHLVAVVRRIAVIGRGEDPFSVPSFADELADGAWAAPGSPPLARSPTCGPTRGSWGANSGFPWAGCRGRPVRSCTATS